jgi:hypothetical protein
MLAKSSTMSAKPFRKKSPENQNQLPRLRGKQRIPQRKLLSADFYGSLVDLGLQLLWHIATLSSQGQRQKC